MAMTTKRPHRCGFRHNVMWGAFLRSSDEIRQNRTILWSEHQFPTRPLTGGTLANCLGRNDDPRELYCGVEPAALFESRDEGQSWSLVRGLSTIRIGHVGAEPWRLSAYQLMPTPA